MAEENEEGRRTVEYVIDLRLVDPQPRLKISVDAHGPRLALKYAEMQNPGYAVEMIDGRKVLGRCRLCRTWVLEGERVRIIGGLPTCEDCY